jgi:hypothetical protein
VLKRKGLDPLFGFRLGQYDRTRPLVIDPVVFLYAGYIGGLGSDDGYGIAVDGEGSAYVTGWTLCTETTFPVTVGPDLTHNSSRPDYTDAFVAKVRADGTGLVYAGYVGGEESDFGEGIAVDIAGNDYITGQTYSSEATFPVLVGPDLTYNGGTEDAFVAKVKADGTGLLYAGYIGGNEADALGEIALDSSGNAYVYGETFSSEASFPVVVGPDLTYNDAGLDTDLFVAKLSALPCTEAAAPIRRVKAVKEPANLDSIDFAWVRGGVGSGYNIWYVTAKDEIPQARQSSSPPGMPVAGCAVPSPATAAACTDQGAVSRDGPTSFFYQVRTYCDASDEGP